MRPELITSGQVDHFNRMGWLLVHDLLKVGVADLQAEVERLSHDATGDWMMHHELTDAGKQVARVEDFTPHSELLRDLLIDSSISSVAGVLLGEQALLYKEKVNFKMSGGAGFSPHQDKPAYPFVDQVLSVMVAVDDSTIENGCLFVVSGRHHELLAQDERGCIAPEAVEIMEWDPVELKAGDTLFFHALTPHRSGPNLSERNRRALFPTYNGISEGDLRASYYAAKREIFESEDPEGDRVRLSLIGDFEGRPA